jgi:hypothetical protein
VLLANVRKAEEEAVKALRRLEYAQRAAGASYGSDSTQRRRSMARANAVRDAGASIHYHQAERITVRKSDPLKER